MVLTSGGQSLTVSLACPRFVFEGAAVDAAPSVTADRAWDGAKPLEIAVTPLALGEDAKLEVRVCATWSPTENVLRKWARFRVSGAASPVLLREVILATLDEPGRWCWDLAAPAGTPSTKPATLAGDRQSRPLFYDGFFAGIEFPVADTRHEGSRAVFAYRPGLRLAAGQWLETHKAVFGIAPRGRELAAFHRYITAHRPPPSGFHLNYNSWWTSPVPYAEADILKLIATFEKALYRPHGVSFDTFCIDLGWSNPRSLWEIDGTMFPAGFAGLKDATARMGSHTGVWISPSGCYSGIAGSLDNEWAAAQGYETFTLGPPPAGAEKPRRFMCLGGPRYRTAIADRLADMVTRYAVRHLKFDGYLYACPEDGHGHEPGELSADAVARGMIALTQAVRNASPDVWIEATCFGWNPSPWWLFHVNSVIGTYGDDAPLGRVPCPVYRESYTTARDYYNLQGSALLAAPICAQEVLGIVHQSDEPLLNDAVLCVLRGHMFLPAYINPAYMNEARWAGLAALLRWARDHADALMATEPLLPASWSGGRVPKFSGGERMPREPYGYAHWRGDGGMVALRNPWIAPQSYPLKLGAGGAAVSVYPQPRVYGRDLRADETLNVALAPYETVVLEIGPRTPDAGLPPVADCIGNRAIVRASSRDFKRVTFEPMPAGGPYGPDWTVVGVEGDSAVRLTLEATVEIRSPQAELIILLDGSRAAAPPVCCVTIDGKAAKVESTGSATGWNASLEHGPEHWRFLCAEVPAGVHSLQVEMLAPEDASAVSAWLWAKQRPAPVTPPRPGTLPAPEFLSVDAARLFGPARTSDVPADPTPVPRRVERIEGVFLDTLAPTAATQGWGTLQRNRSVTEGPIAIAGQRYLRGLGTHSPSRITYALDGKWRRFLAWAGADDATSPTVTFEVHVDGQKRWESGRMTRGTPARRVDVDVSGAQTLELIVGDAGDTYTADHADWADAKLLPSGGSE